MKIDSTKYWRFQNHGYPKDMEEGEGDAKALALALMKFWARVTMGSRITVEVYRDEASRSGKSKAEQDVEAIFADAIGDLDLTGMVE